MTSGVEQTPSFYADVIVESEDLEVRRQGIGEPQGQLFLQWQLAGLHLLADFPQTDGSMARSMTLT